MELIATDAAYRSGNIEYLFKTLGKTVALAGGAAKMESDAERCTYKATVTEANAELFKRSLEDKVADVIAVNYKYEYFKRYIRPSGLTAVEYDLLLSALIAADIEEDKRYVLSRLSAPYAIDGSFIFLMKPLKRKWKEVVGYVPSYFNERELKDFIAYIVGEKRGRRVYVVNGGVFDGQYNKLFRSTLAGGGDIRTVKEVLLSSSGEVELDCKLKEVEEYYLKEFFGDKIFFRKGYFS